MEQEKLIAADILHSAADLAHELNIIIQDSLPSTNDYILNLLNTDTTLPNKTLVLAEIQTSGKGRQGRVWVSPPGNVYMSLYWRFQASLQDLHGMSLVVGVAVARVLKSIGLIEVKFKRPNDIFWQQRKMGGILVETKSRAGVVDSVIGIGLNVGDMRDYQTQISQEFVALEEALQYKVDRNKLVGQFLSELNQVLQQFAVGGFDVFVEEFEEFTLHSEKMTK